MDIEYIKKIAELFDILQDVEEGSAEYKDAYGIVKNYLNSLGILRFGLSCGCGYEDGYCGDNNMFYWALNGVSYATDGNDVWINDDRIALGMAQERAS